MTKVSFYGAAGEVTGSNFLIETESNKYIVDCGLFQGRDTISELNDDPLAYNAAEVSHVMVTHAHLDHIGRLPVLVRHGYHGPIFATEATIELATIVLKDALGLAEERSRREGKPQLYEEEDLNRTLQQFQAVPYRKPHRLNGQDQFTLYDAGHILGSASILLEAGGKKIIFSGDIGHWPSPLLAIPEPPPAADLVITEATYGGEEHLGSDDREQVVKKALEWTSQNNGVLLIPAFSIERSQELLFLLHEMFEKHQLPKMPIFLDSPLAIEALAVFEHHMELYRREVVKDEHGGHNLFDFGSLALTPTVEDSKDINDAPHPKVIIAGSGMMAGGRIVHHLKHYLSRPDTYLLIIGFQAPGTLGSAILGGAKSVHIHGQEVAVRAKIEVAEAFSGHADNSELMQWLRKIEMPSGGRLAIVHSEPDRAEKYLAFVKSHLPAANIVIPKIGTSIEV
ncbi:MAG: MBL fold metallo-hydrolase [Patescibacteria group bacterium]